MTLPDLGVKFCKYLVCNGHLGLSSAQLGALFKSTGRKGPVLSMSVALKEPEGRIRLSLFPLDKNRARFSLEASVLGYPPRDSRRRSQQDVERLERILNAIGNVAGEATLRITGNFSYPSNRFASRIPLPAEDDPGKATAPIRLVGLRFELTREPLVSVSIDVGNREIVAVVVSSTLTVSINDALPQAVLALLSGIAEGFVSLKT